ncbi:MAG: flagellar biosynthesis anti-sigma factor FlgM [Acidobacteriaceae bacterium]|nr:flagellar biosynthesis anti-sigma factor FlgM [Acidobacteriaceae bacterium]
MGIQVNTSAIDGASEQTSSTSVRHVSATKPAGGADAADLSATDTVHLSGASDLVALAKNMTSTDRQARLASLADQIRSGRYEVNADDVSHAIVRSLIDG